MKKKFLILGIIFFATLLVWTLFFRDVKVMGKASLSWNPSADSNLKGYNVYYDTHSRKGDCPATGGYGKSISVGNRTSYQIDGLENGATYYFSVTSVLSNGQESCFSDEMQKIIKLNWLDKIKAGLKLGR